MTQLSKNPNNSKRPKTLANIVVRHLNEILFERGISLYAFAKQNDISPSTFKNYWNGHVKNPNLALMLKVVNALGMTLTDFLHGAGLSEEDVLLLNL